MARKRKKTRRAAPRGSSSRSGLPWPKILRLAGPLAVALVLLVPPFVILPGIEEAFRLPKLFVSELLALLSLLLLAPRVVNPPVGTRTRRRLGAFCRHPAVLAAAPILAVALLGLATSDHGVFVRRALPSLAIGLAALVAWSTALDDRERWRLLGLLTVPATVLAVLVVLQFHGLFDPFVFEGDVSDRIGLTSLAGGAFDLAGYLVLPILVMQARFPAAGTRERILLGVAFVVAVYALGTTRTLTAVAALVVGMVLLAWRQLSRRSRPWAAGAVLAAALLLTLATPVGHRVAKKVENLAENGRWNRFLSGRLDGWSTAAWMFEQHPIVGVGHGAFRAEFGDARLALQDQGRRFFQLHKQPFFVHAHSEPLHVAAEGGFLGLVALAWGGGVLVVAVRRRRRDLGVDPGDDQADRVDTRPPGLHDLLWPGSASLAVLALANFPFHLALQAYPWLLFLALALDSPKGDPSRDGSEADDSAGAESISRLPGRLLAIGLALAAVVALSARVDQARDRLAVASGLRQLDAQAAALWGQQDRIPKPQLEQILRSHLAVLDDLARFDPAEVRVPMAVGGRYYLMGRPDAAVRAYEEALALERRGEVYLNLARSHRAAGEQELANEAARLALRLAPDQRETLESLGFLAPEPGDEPGRGASFEDDFETGDTSGWAAERSAPETNPPTREERDDG